MNLKVINEPCLIKTSVNKRFAQLKKCSCALYRKGGKWNVLLIYCAYVIVLGIIVKIRAY